MIGFLSREDKVQLEQDSFGQEKSKISLIDQFEFSIAPERSALLSHPLFSAVNDLARARFFMEAHVFAVLDFMSLVKSLQAKITCVTVPWVPPPHRDSARFINEIVLGEESDEIEPGFYISHFELYLAAMKDCGADTSFIENFVSQIQAGREISEALEITKAPHSVRSFVETTFSFCRLEVHQIAAAFLYGREDIIPDMFKSILSEPSMSTHPQLKRLRRYLERHIEVDGDSHGPMARKLMQNLCGENKNLWAEAEVVARQALKARHQLWDRVLAGLIERV